MSQPLSTRGSIDENEWPARLDRAADDLRRRAPAWSTVPIAEKRAYLDEIGELVAASAAEWVELACRHKGLHRRSPLAGEEWLSGPWALLSYVSALGETLDALSAGRSPLGGIRASPGPGGRVALRVLPHDVFDRVLLNGYRADVRLAPGVTIRAAGDTAGRALREPDGRGVSLVLGPGNISSIAPLDALYRLCAANRVVLLKLNPVNEYLGPVLGPLSSRGFIRLAYGDADVGAHLVRSAAIDDVHVTGSVATHNAIVFGPGEEGARRRVDRKLLLDKPITSELGGVAPVIVAPGRWSRADLRYQAEHLATQKLHNSGLNCIAAQVVILPRAWTQKDDFLEQLRITLGTAPARPAYYPGAADRHAAALASYPDAERLATDGRLLVRLTDTAELRPACQIEFFAPVLAVVELRGEDVDAFLQNAVAFANSRLNDTLSAGLVLSPSTAKRHHAALVRTIEQLRYGSIGINCWTALAYLTARAPWGAFPGHVIDDVQSGVGVVHNALLVEQTERTVVRGPFRPAPRSLIRGERSISPKPPWFVTNRTAAITGRRLTSFAARPSWRRVVPVVASALHG